MLRLFLAKIFAVVTKEVDRMECKLPINKKDGLAFKSMVVWTWILPWSSTLPLGT
jgi:hypothetical protein